MFSSKDELKIFRCHPCKSFFDAVSIVIMIITGPQALLLFELEEKMPTYMYVNECSLLSKKSQAQRQGDLS